MAAACWPSATCSALLQASLFATAIQLTWAIRTLWAKPQAMASHALLCQSEDICPESGLLLRRRTEPSEGKEHRGHQLRCTKACGGSAQRFPVRTNQLIHAAWILQALRQPLDYRRSGLACAAVSSSGFLIIIAQCNIAYSQSKIGTCNSRSANQACSLV